jgi:magnesium transporter
MLGHALREDLKELIDGRDWNAIRDFLEDEDLEPADIAEILEEIPSGETALLFRILPRAKATDIFELLPVETQAELVEALSREQIESILNEMAPDDRTRLLEELPAAVVQRALAQLHPEQLKVARRLLGYPERSAGRVMTPEYVALPPLMTSAQALVEIRKRARRVETVSTIYLVDEKGRLVDDIDLSAIALAPDDATLASIADGNFVAVKASEDQGEVVRQFEKYDRFALPVLDGQGVLVGIITADDVLDVAEREATEDIQKLGGSAALESPYLETPFADMMAKRGPWLIVLFFGQMFTATAMAYFEGEIERAVVLALFIPLVISSGGNTGSQSTSILIRALALGEVSLRDWWRVARRELMTGLALGAILGVLGLLRIVLWPNRESIYGEHFVLVGVTVMLALLGVVLFGTIVGAMLPLILKRVRLDPATASAPFVATLVDVTGLVIYFTIASFVLRGTLL